MHDRREEHAHHDQKDDSGVEGVGRREQLGGRSVELPHRTHAAQDHGGVECGVDPRHVSEDVVTDDTDGQRASQDADGEAKVPEDPPQELLACQKGLLVVLEHGSSSSLAWSWLRP